jgi:hypothetical protein
MSQQAIFGPAFALLGLTLVVWVLMYLRRRAFVLAHRIRLRDVATPETLARTLDEYAASPGNNFRNLCEMPVLFYVLCLYLFVTGRVDAPYLALAWLFFGFRVLHSYVHCTSNRVSRRLLCYALAGFAFWAMALRAAFQYFT